MSNAKISRRLVLKSAVATLGLPVLDSLFPYLGRVAQAQVDTPKAVFLMFPIGNLRGTWEPVGYGSSYQLPAELSALAPYKSDLILPKGLRHPNFWGFGPNSPEALRLAGTIPGGHHFLGANFLTSNIPLLGGAVTNSESIDNRIARLLGQDRATYLTPKVDGLYDEGYSKEYLINFSWQKDGRSNPRYESPKALFESLFGVCTGTGGAQPRYKRNLGSILDGVNRDLASLQSKAGSADRAKLEQFTTSLREVEKSIGAATGLACSHPEYLTDPSSFLTLTKTNLDIIALGLQSGSSKVFSYLMDREVSQRTFSWLGINDGHHYLSHDASGTIHTTEIGKITRWYVDQFAYLLGALKSSGVLDSTVVFFGSQFSNEGPKDAHGTDSLPILLAGSAGGRFKVGQGIDTKNAPLANLYLTMIRNLGGTDASFGNPNPDPKIYYYNGTNVVPDPKSTGVIQGI